MNIIEYAKRLGVEAPTAKAVDIAAGKAGYQKYLADTANGKIYLPGAYSNLEDYAQQVDEWNDKSFGEKLNSRWQNFKQKLGVGDTKDYVIGGNVPEQPLMRFLKGELSWDQVQAISRGIVDQDYARPGDDWTDEERWAFGEAYAKSSTEAFKLAEEINAQHALTKKEKQAKRISEWTERNMVNSILGSVGSLGINAFAGGAGYTEALLEKGVRGRTYENDYLMPHEIANTMQGTVAENLSEKSKALGYAYNIGMSVGQSILAGKTGGSSGALVQFFGMAASNGFTDAKSRGADDNQALAFGALSGIAEAIPEMITVDKFLGLASAAQVDNVFKSILKQAGAEALEEATTSALTEVADRWVMGGKSQYALTVQELMASGMTEAEAKNKAFTQTLLGIAGDAVTGAISGTASGGIAVGFNKLNNKYFQRETNAEAKKALTPEASNLISEGKKYDSTSKQAARLEQKMAEGKELSGYELRRLANELGTAEHSSEVDSVRQAIIEKMKTEGVEEKDAKRLGEIALNKALGNEVSKIQDVMLKRNEAALKVYNQIDAKNMASGESDSEWIEKTPLRKLRYEAEAAKNNANTESKPTADMSGVERLKAKALARKLTDSAQYKINDASLEGKFTVSEDDKVKFVKSSEESKIHTDEISSSLTKDEIAQIAAIEKLANELGVNIHMYESTKNKDGSRTFTRKDGTVTSDSGWYDPNDRSIHIDLRAGEKGEGTMLYTAAHELVHFMKDVSPEHFDALEKLVMAELVKGGKSVEHFLQIQRASLIANGKDQTDADFEAVAREEMIADACMKFLASDSAVAEIKALKTKNKGLWNALKKFFTSFFKKIDKIYKDVDPDSSVGKYIGDMHSKAKAIRDAFMEGITAAGNKMQSESETKATFEKSYQKTKDIRKNARYTKEHIDKLKSIDASASSVPIDNLVERYETIIGIWNELGGELNSEFLKQWNDKSGKDRAFSVFKAQAGYKYNVELSSMCKKGIPLFEAIDQIVRSEVMNRLNTKTLGKAEKEILYELLKERKFDIPCAICYVEQARQREGDIIDAFLDGKIEKTSAGKTKTHKIGWNETFDALEKGMKARGVDYTFKDVSRNIASDSYTKETVPSMDEKTQKAFYDTLLNLINKEISRYNSEKSAKTKARMPLKSVTPSEIKRCLGGTLPANLKLYKTIAINPDSRFRIKNDLLYSSETTTNLASYHHDLYSLFNMQGGVSGYKSKQGTVVYWGDILTKNWDSSKLKKEGGVRNQSNSDFMMYTLLDQAQMYIDFTAKGYYLQAYTKVLSELKLFGLSKGKINASLIPRVEMYRKSNGDIDDVMTRENAGLDKNGNPIYDDIEGIPHEEAFMLIEDAEYSKSIGGICIGYSDNHISKLLDDSRIQLIIGYHDKTDDPNKRYYGARYAKNYNGENEARIKNDDGTFTTKHVGFNQYVIAAEKLFKKNVTTVDYEGKTYKYDDIPKLAADMYLKMCADKNYIPAYNQFSSHENYYKLLADFSLYDSEGHYAPHQKVAYDMPDVVPYLDADGNKKYMPTRDYIKKELKKELTVRDDISATLSDHSEEGLIPQFVKKVNELHSETAKQESAKKEIRSKARGTFNINDYSIDELIKFTDEEFEQAINSLSLEDILTDEDWNDPNLWKSIDSSIEDLSEKLDTTPTKARILIRRQGLGNSYIDNREKAVMSQKRINEAIEDSGATNPGYARKYITRISTKDFIDLTVSKDHMDRNTFDSRVVGDHGSKMGEYDYEKALKDSRFSPRLSIDRETGRVIGHDGRHRIRALEKAGIKSIEIEVEFFDTDGSLIKYDAETIPNMAISSQFDSDIETTISNVIPLNESHREEIEKTYGEKAHPKAEIRYKSRQKVDTNAQKDYNIYYQSKAFMREIHYEDRNDFSRWLAHKTTDIKDGETKLVFIHCGVNVYAFEAVGYMQGRLLNSWNVNKLESAKAYKEKKHAINKDAEIADLWNEPIQSIIGYGENDLFSVRNRRRSTSDGLLSENTSKSNRAGHNENVYGYNIPSREELDRILTELKRIYGGSENTTLNSDENSSKEIRSKARSTPTASIPYTSPTAKSIVTNIDSGYTYTKADKVKTSYISAQIAMTNAQAGIEARAKQYGVKNIEALVQAARVATNQAQEMIGGNQYRIGSDTKDYLGEGLQKIYKPIQEKGEEYERTFFDYLFHQHNADRMSLERRSIEWNEQKKEEMKNLAQRSKEIRNEEMKLTGEKTKWAYKRSEEARSERNRIDLKLKELSRELVSIGKARRKLQKEIDSFEALKNKPVIGLNHDEVEAKKAEISARITELVAEKRKLGTKKSNEEKVKEINAEIEALKQERSELTAEVTEEKSREIIAEYEKNYPEFIETAQKIWKYSENLNLFRVDAGLIDQEQFDYLKKLYPHYVPTYRADTKTGIAAIKGKNNVAVSQSIRTATGSTKDLLNPIVIMARQTMETIRAGRINMIAKALYDGAAANNDTTYIKEISKKAVDKSKLVDLDPTELRPKSNQVTFFKDGQRITLQVSSDIFAGFDAFTPQVDATNPILQITHKANDIFKKLVTSWNPLFIIRNSIRDIQDAGINTKYGKTFVQNYFRAGNEIRKGGELWELYKAMGGTNVNLFDFDKGFKGAQSKMGFEAGLMKKIANANAFVECLPRFAEFISSIEAGNTAEQAMLDAADVTTNFARTGTITKKLNSTIIPFLNPAIQGASKAIRNITSIRSFREALILITKAALVGVLPFVLNNLLLDDDEDYKDLKETDKENNYLIKVGDVFLKLPRGRMASVLAGATNRTIDSINGEEKAWKGYLKNVSTQMNPVENMSRTIFSPFMDVKNNVTWYGSAIEGREFENKSPAQRYDESTSSIAIAIGKVINRSPKKIHYLIDQYSGVIGDLFLPATTKKAEKGFISGNLTIDPVLSNELSDKFYDMYYDAQYAKSDNPDDKTAEYQVKHLNRVKDAISELYDEKDKIQNSDKSNAEKRDETRTIQILINELYKTALNDYELVTNAIEATSSVDDKYRYTEIQRLVYGAETALKDWDDTVYEKSTLLAKNDISYDNFYKYYFGIKDIESDKDKEGNTISGSKKKKVIEKIEDLSISDENKLLLIAYSGYTIDSEKDREKLLKYLNRLTLSTDNKKKLADMCGFQYKNGKIVYENK